MAAPRVGVLGTNGSVSVAEIGFEAALKRVGLNFGNLLFQRAFWDRVRNPKIEIGFDTPVEVIREKVDVVVFPAANQVGAGDLDWWATWFAAIGKPIVVAGLGAQASIGGDVVELSQGTQRFIRVLGEYAAWIGVRGTFTQEILARYGVRNTVVTGCPSNFISPRVTGASIERAIDRVRAAARPRGFYMFGTMEPETREAEKVLFRIARSLSCTPVYQSGPGTLRAVLTGVLDAEAEKYIDWERAVLAPEMTSDSYTGWMIHGGRVFQDAGDWVAESGRQDISFGMRIHGAVAAIQGGSLGLCVAFDSRTLELARTMGYPFVRADQLQPGDDLRSVMGKISFVPRDFDVARRQLLGNFLKVCQAGDVQVDLDGWSLS
jgi:hypothetical protein